MATKNKGQLRKIVSFIFIQLGIIALCLFSWGFVGKVSSAHFEGIVKVLPQSQKELLANSLNFYYNQGFAKYSRGLLLECEAETESIINQFSWFHRNTFTYYLKDPPAYHEILASTVDYFEIMDESKAKELNTYRLESKFIYWHTANQPSGYVTPKDKSDLLLSLVDFGVNLFVSTTSPVGLSAAAISLLSKAGSDPAKSMPAIVVFHKLRVQNMSISIAILTLLNLMFCKFLFRKS
ncbi:MAG: hypothetical protein MK132_03340 [Lentisphaerales bacterium]|nr:hypothetical protein [Lentisphaerales bacterium]